MTILIYVSLILYMKTNEGFPLGQLTWLPVAEFRGVPRREQSQSFISSGPTADHVFVLFFK